MPVLLFVIVGTIEFALVILQGSITSNALETAIGRGQRVVPEASLDCEQAILQELIKELERLGSSTSLLSLQVRVTDMGPPEKIQLRARFRAGCLFCAPYLGGEIEKVRWLNFDHSIACTAEEASN